MKSHASAHWSGGLKDGKGTVSTGGGALDGTPYDFRMRFEDAPGTTPEELIGASHAACYSMALSMVLGEAGMVAEAIDTKATVTLDLSGDAPTVTSSHLELVAKIPGADEAKFMEAANGAKAGCPISRLLNCDITLDARLES